MTRDERIEEALAKVKRILLTLDDAVEELQEAIEAPGDND